MAEQQSKRRDRQMVRILGILGALLEGGQPTVRSLAARFGTRRETIYRDIRALEAAGYPIAGDESGCLSRPRLLPAARRAAPELRLSEAEIAALLWAAGQAGASPFREALGGASAKLRAMARQENTAALASVLTEGGWGGKDYAPHRETIVRLVEAILRRRLCEVTYLSPAAGAPKSYGFHPYRITAVAGGLYCLGRVPPRDGLTTLAIDRIQNLQISETDFHIEPNLPLELDRHRREAFGVIWEKPMNVVLRFDAGQAPYVRERLWHPTQRIHDLADGGVRLSFRAGGLFEIARWVMGWGQACEVLRPKRLRDYVRDAMRAASAQYDPAVAESGPGTGGKATP